MRPTRFSRLVALVAAALLVVGCASAPLTVEPAAAAPTLAPLTVQQAPTLGAATVPSAYPVAPEAQAAYPQPVVGALPPGGQQLTPTLGYRVVTSYPHDPFAYTQGLVYIGGDSFYEGTGLVGASSLREVTLSGEIRRNLPVPGVFGEGVAVVGERIFQLTWQNCVGYIYNRADFKRVGQFSMPTNERTGSCLEGWGLTYDGKRLILSDGSERLFFVDPAATERTGQLAITGQIAVRDSLGPVVRLNELEYIQGEIYANLYTDTKIARINPATGAVTAYIELRNLFALLPATPNAPVPEVLNGIAYDAAGDRLFVTGKQWPLLFEIDLVSPLSWVVYLPLAEAA